MHHELKVQLWAASPYTATQHDSFYRRSDMNTATITTAHDKGLRSTVASLAFRIRTFAVELYAVHGGWLVLDAGQPASGAMAHAARARRAKLAAVR
jgi:hypothetical protein